MEFFQTPLQKGTELDLGNVTQRERKRQNLLAKSEACASSLPWEAEFQHLLGLLRVSFSSLLYLSQRDTSSCQESAERDSSALSRGAQGSMVWEVWAGTCPRNAVLSPRAVGRGCLQLLGTTEQEVGEANRQRRPRG